MMHQSLQLISNYRGEKTYRQSFNQLATAIFSYDFERWYQLGWWPEHYCSYLYVDNATALVVAHAGVYKAHFHADGRKLTAVQLYATMTHPAYRRRGLLRSLTEVIIQDYGQQVDLIYALANGASRTNFLRFGLQVQEESEFFCHVSAETKRRVAGGKRKLYLDRTDDRRMLLSFLVERMPLSQRFHVENTQSLFLLHCLNAFKDTLYYVMDEDVIVLCKHEGRTLHIYDLLCKRVFSVQSVLDKILNEETTEIIFACMPPDWSDLSLQCRPFDGEEQFVLRPSLATVGRIRYPILA
jgi:GNAT superfamily N-acetyltransferase